MLCVYFIILIYQRKKNPNYLQVRETEEPDPILSLNILSMKQIEPEMGQGKGIQNSKAITTKVRGEKKSLKNMWEVKSTQRTKGKELSPLKIAGLLGHFQTPVFMQESISIKRVKLRKEKEVLGRYQSMKKKSSEM